LQGFFTFGTGPSLDMRKTRTSSSASKLDRRSFLKGTLASAAVLASTALPGRVFALPDTHPDRDLFAPRGIAVSTDGTIYVADAGNYRVHVFESGGASFTRFGGPGTAEGQFNFPTDLALLGDELLVLDTNNGRICRLDRRDGKFLGSFGSLGGSADRLFTPEGIAVSKDRIFVANTRSHCVQAWSTKSGRVENVIGMLGDEPSVPALGDRDVRFRLPTAVAVDQSGARLFIADSRHGRVVETRPDGSFVQQIDAANTGAKLLRPQDLCLQNEVLYIADTGNRRVVRYELASQNLSVVTGDWTEPVGVARFDRTLLVVDAGSKSIISAVEEG
jgi:DNA-binding beta-propeller fold protein YncE